jgi:phosphoenolpyruvate carboxykinase (ATP)
MYGLEKLGIANVLAVHYNLSPAELTEKALANGEGKLNDTGALVIETGKYTGRAPDDKFFVDTPSVHNHIDWSRNKPIESEKFDAILGKLIAYLQKKEIYVFDGKAGANPQYTRRFRFINEMPSQNLFIHQLLIRTDEEYNENNKIDFTVISAPNFHCVPEIDGVNSEAAIIINFEKKMAIICGTRYSGEMKKSVFSIMNYIMPLENILPMHCSANMDPVTHETAIFFGLSGTGKTTLSADPDRKLIGDDEHGWCDTGVFNFEGGCYAKCINLKEESEPEIYHAIKFGSVVENVTMDEKTRKINYEDASITPNTRVGYPIHYIPNAELAGVGGIPKVVIFLTADSFGVLPPISRLSQEAAMYHFVTGFTAKLAGTELGVKEPVPTFSTCFGEPFMPMDPSVYAKMLGERLEKHNTKVYLINTGWSGGAYGTGKRINLKYTRAMVTAVLSGYFDNAEYKHDEIFNLDIPQSCPNVPSEIMNPIDTWEDKEQYIIAAKKLANLFYKNFKEKYSNMPENITNAGPRYND